MKYFIIFHQVLLLLAISVRANHTIEDYSHHDLAINETIIENTSGISIDSEILNKIKSALKGIVSTRCLTDINATISGIIRKNPWAIAMYDASVKVPFGIEYGATYQFGSFDQCMNLRLTAVTSAADDDVDGLVEPKYCLADVTMDGFNVRDGVRRDFRPTNQTTIQWAVCVPASCSEIEIGTLLTRISGHKEVSVSPDKCHTNKPTKLTALDIFYGCVILMFATLTLMCTSYHVYMYMAKDLVKMRSRGGPTAIILSFSMFENFQKIVKGSTNDELGLSAINGIKAITMICILCGHALLFMSSGPVLNSEFIAKEIKLVKNAFLINSPLLVDSFLMLSGFLFTRLLLLELDKRRGHVNFGLLYIFRYVRLTPAYLAVIGLYTTWLPKLGSGPLWDSRMGAEQKRCQSSWWINLLYLNNYIGTDNLCMFQSWYLSVDTQLFILAPLIVYPLWRWRKIGLLSLVGLAIVSILIPIVSTYVNDTDPTLLSYTDETLDISVNYYFTNYYIKTHMRATTYIFGILTGFLVHYIQEKNKKLSQLALWVGWTVSIIAGISSLCFIVIFFDNSTSRATRSIYAGFHRLGWGVAMSWIVLTCVLGYAGNLKSLLTSKFFVPISRLTYCAYLTNGLVELYHIGTIRSVQYMSTVSLFGATVSHLFMTFIGALILCLILESPIHGLEKILLRREKQQNSLNHSDKSDSDSNSSIPSLSTDSTK